MAFKDSWKKIKKPINIYLTVIIALLFIIGIRVGLDYHNDYYIQNTISVNVISNFPIAFPLGPEVIFQSNDGIIYTSHISLPDIKAGQKINIRIVQDTGEVTRIFIGNKYVCMAWC